MKLIPLTQRSSHLASEYSLHVVGLLLLSAKYLRKTKTVNWLISTCNVSITNCIFPGADIKIYTRNELGLFQPITGRVCV